MWSFCGEELLCWCVVQGAHTVPACMDVDSVCSAQCVQTRVLSAHDMLVCCMYLCLLCTCT